MKKLLSPSFQIVWVIMGAVSAVLSGWPALDTCFAGTDYYVSESGDDTGPGTFDEPFETIQRAVYAVAPGDTIYIREGVYDIDVAVDVSGSSGNPITMQSYPGEHAVLDGSSHAPPESVKLRITGSYWIIRDLEIRNGPSDGVLITESGGNNILENLECHENYFAGIMLENGAHDNLIENCDSYLNFDSGDTHGEHADGFGAKYAIGPGNRFQYCRAWNNSDDGFDLWDADYSVEISHCWAYGNGVDRWGVGSQFAGDGNGFKLGPNSPVIHHCMAWNNAQRGFDYNDATDIEYVYNNTSYNHPLSGFNFSGAGHVLRNNLSFADAGNAIDTAVDDQNNSWNTPPGVTVDSSDFISLDDTSARGSRRENGTLPETDFLALAPDSDLIDAGVDVGYPYSGNAPDIGAREYTEPETPATSPLGLALMIAVVTLVLRKRAHRILS